MVEPTEKSPGIESLLTGLMGKSRIDTIHAGLCMTCDRQATDFRDALSVHEYTISGMYQLCQDEVFGTDDG